MLYRKPKVKPIARMIDDPNKEIHKTYGTDGLLSKLWRVILKENNVTGFRFASLMERFLAENRKPRPDNPKEHFDNRGNLNKEFSNPAMSWKVFCKCMRFMRFTEFRITLEARHDDGHISSHRVMVNLSNGLKENPLFDEETQPTDNTTVLKVPSDQEHIPYLDDDEEEDDQ